MRTRIEHVDPRTLRLLDVNARYMTQQQYARLVENIRRDGVLTSVPLVCQVGEDRVVLSGNHRVRASIDAGLETIPIMFLEGELPKQRRVAMQLAHNAVAGQDDVAILAQLWADLDDVDWKAYAGLDDEVLAQLEKVTPASISEFNLDHRVLGFLFLPHELEGVERAFDAAIKDLRPGELWLADLREFDRLLDALETVEKRVGVRNRAVALRLILDVFEKHADELAAERESVERAGSAA